VKIAERRAAIVKANTAARLRKGQSWLRLG
jgi:hypothetical protein